MVGRMVVASVASLVLAVAGAAPASAQAWNPAASGDHIIVTEQLDGLVRPDGATSRLDVVLPVDVSRTWPVVLFVHGWSAEPGHYDGLVNNLASRGFAVAKFDQIDTFDQDLRRWIEGGKTAIDALEAATQDPASPLFGLLDMSKLAVVGHSYGGATTICLAATDARIKTAVAITPGVSEEARPVLLAHAPRVTVPLLVIGSEFDPIVRASRFARPVFDVIGSRDKRYVELARGEHLNFTDFGFAYFVWRPLTYGGWVKTMDPGLMRALSRGYTNAWVEHHLGLRADTQGYVDGRMAAFHAAARLVSRFR